MDPNTHAGPATEAFEVGATKRMRGVPKLTQVTIWTLPLRNSVELPTGHETCEGCAFRNGDGDDGSDDDD
eukprot:8136450-Pyramimonas_sp.AAC.1